MLKMRLDSLKINNFKGIEHFELFPRGNSMDIYGDNATGKTTVYDALVWLLFGRDSMDNTNFDIKPLDEEGNIKDSSALTEVSAVFNLNGEDIQLKKTYYEKWSGKRGSIEKTFDGNTSGYYIDDVPVKKYEYEEQIKNIVDKDMFKILTNVNYFAKILPWQERRKVLFNICNLPDDHEIMQTDEKFSPLLEIISNKTPEDLKKKLIEKRKSFSTVKNKIPAKIESLVHAAEPFLKEDYDALELEYETLKRRHDELNKEKILLENDTICLKKNNELSDIKNKILELETENIKFRRRQEQEKSSADSLNVQLKAENRELERINSEYEKVRALTDRMETHISKLREQWQAKEKTKWEGDTVCPVCKREYSGESIAAALEAFEKDKSEQLKNITLRAEEEKNLLEEQNNRLLKLIEEKAEANERIMDIKSRIELEKSIPVLDMPGYMESISSLIKSEDLIKKEIQAYMTVSSEKRREIEGNIKDTECKIKSLGEKISGKSFIKHCEDERASLMEEARAAGKALEKIESQIFLLEEFTRYKASFVTDMVNSKFNIAQFKLFKELVNGAVEDCCTIAYKGVSFESNLNTGARTCVGIDIINTLSESFNVSVPLFIDNAESITNLYPADTQVIRLIVNKEDKKLRCVYWD